MQFLLLTATIVMVFFSGCIRLVDDEFHDKCKEPIYLSYTVFREKPTITTAQEIQKAGKIYIYKDILFINEPNIGIHVIDNSNKQHPQNKYFIDLPGNLDIAVKDGYLYADSFMDLVVLNVNDIDHITKVHRQESVFPYDPYQILTNNDTNYCYIDADKGVVIGYQK